MRNAFLLLMVFVSSLAFADANPWQLNKDELTKLGKISDNSVLLQCATIYEFDAFLSPFGLDLSVGANESDSVNLERRYVELRSFLDTGKLTLRSSVFKPPFPLTKQLSDRCEVIAQTVLEAQALQMRILLQALPQAAPSHDQATSPKNVCCTL